jgi:uncharacterized protein YggE
MKTWKTIGFAIAVVAVMAIAMIGNATAAIDQNSADQQVIQTSSTGEVKASPDRAMISASVETNHQDAKVAQAQNAQAMASVMAALTNAGISEDDLQTTGYSIYPVYDSSGSSLLPRTVQTYRVVNTLVITLRDVNRSGEIIDLAVANGANRVDSIAFTLSEERQQQVRAQAITVAVRMARADADAVAGAAGLTILRVKDITVGQNYYPISYRNAEYAGAGDKTMAATPIVAGDVTVSAQVTVTYLCS